MMNNRGFTVTELLVSFVITVTITVLLFSLIISLQKTSSQNYAKSDMKILSANVFKLIKDDMKKYDVSSITSCGSNCYNINYQTKGSTVLKIDRVEKSLTYGNYKTLLKPNSYFGADLSLTVKNHSSVTAPKYNTLLNIKIVVNNEFYDGDYGINLVQQFNHNITVS